jgi:hypothetical protein
MPITKRAGRVAQVKALSSRPSTAKKKKKILSGKNTVLNTFNESLLCARHYYIWTFMHKFTESLQNPWVSVIVNPSFLQTRKLKPKTSQAT